MGPAGVEYVYKDELRSIRQQAKTKLAAEVDAQRAAGLSDDDARRAAEELVAQWVRGEEQLLAQRYERELMNPNEALSLGSISQIVMPSDLRQVLTEQMEFCLRHYEPAPMGGVQREFH